MRCGVALRIGREHRLHYRSYTTIATGTTSPATVYQMLERMDQLGGEERMQTQLLQESRFRQRKEHRQSVEHV
jgi:hypothetical protein